MCWEKNPYLGSTGIWEWYQCILRWLVVWQNLWIMEGIPGVKMDLSLGMTASYFLWYIHAFYSDNSNKSLHKLLIYWTKINTFFQFWKACWKLFVTNWSSVMAWFLSEYVQLLLRFLFPYIEAIIQFVAFLLTHINFPLVSLQLIICSYTWCTGTWVQSAASLSAHLLRKSVTRSIY